MIRRAAGFTLLELAMVLMVLGLVLAGGIGPLETQLEQRDRAATQVSLERVRDALLGYAGTYGRLPCPDADGDGLPDPVFDPTRKASASCARSTGFLPGAELGVLATDAWGNRLVYRVTAPRFTWPDADGLCNGNASGELDLCAQGEITVRSRGDNPQTNGRSEGKFDLVLADKVPALVVSPGRNRAGATGANGLTHAAPSGEDEQDNANGDARYLLRNPTRGAPSCSDSGNEATPLCEFDDLGVWLSPVVLQERLVASGRLP